MRSPGYAKIVAHPLVFQTARDMAHALYNQLMLDNTCYAEWKKQCPELTPKELERRFVALLTPKLLLQARATLAHMLTLPYDEVLKEQIADALIKDRGLMRGRGRDQLTFH